MEAKTFTADDMPQLIDILTEKKNDPKGQLEEWVQTKPNPAKKLSPKKQAQPAAKTADQKDSTASPSGQPEAIQDTTRPDNPGKPDPAHTEPAPQPHTPTQEATNPQQALDTCRPPSPQGGPPTQAGKADWPDPISDVLPEMFKPSTRPASGSSGKSTPRRSYSRLDSRLSTKTDESATGDSYVLEQIAQRTVSTLMADDESMKYLLRVDKELAESTKEEAQKRKNHPEISDENTDNDAFDMCAYLIVAGYVIRQLGDKIIPVAGEVDMIASDVVDLKREVKALTKAVASLSELMTGFGSALNRIASAKKTEQVVARRPERNRITTEVNPGDEGPSTGHTQSVREAKKKIASSKAEEFGAEEDEFIRVKTKCYRAIVRGGKQGNAVREILEMLREAKDANRLEEIMNHYQSLE